MRLKLIYFINNPRLRRKLELEKKKKKEKKRGKRENLKNFKINHKSQPTSYVNNVWSEIGPEKELQPHSLVQYLFEHEEHNVIKLLPYGNSNKKHPYWQLLKDSKNSAKKPKPYLDEVYCSSQDICFSRSLSEHFRGLKDV